MKESTKWFLFIIAGALIVFLLGIHIVIMHFDDLLYSLGVGDKDVLSYESVAHRSKIFAHVVIYILLLGAALYHGLYGFRSLLFELPLGKSLHNALSIIITIAGVLLFIYGAHAIIIGYIS